MLLTLNVVKFEIAVEHLGVLVTQIRASTNSWQMMEGRQLAYVNGIQGSVEMEGTLL